MNETTNISPAELVKMALDARGRTLSLVNDLDDDKMMGPRLAIVNPLLWEIGHVAWFQERWVLRHARKRNPMMEGCDRLYNSADVQHDTRWDLLLPSRERTLNYMQQVLEEVIDGVEAGCPSEEEVYFHLLATFHEDMHGEAIAYTRQTLEYPAPKLSASVTHESAAMTSAKAPLGDVEIPGGVFLLGATPRGSFVFDNEKWAHPVSVPPFRICRTPVTNSQFLHFVEDGGYLRSQCWSHEGRAWRENVAAEHPVYWRRGSGQRWYRRHFDSFVPLEPNLPVIHVNWYEAEAYCRWAGRRLPTEAEWEMAASAEARAAGQTFQQKRNFPWGNKQADMERANLDGHRPGCVAVEALAAGDSAFGCRQMIGNVWEWTASDFQPYPGFVIDPYKEYSAPWFGTHKVLRGGSWVTRSRLIRNTWRNFYTPDRRDVWAGFRTCEG